MRARFSVPRSRAAEWARFIGGLAVPVLALGAIGARLGFVPGEALIPVLVLGFALGLIATGLAAYALVDIWHSGGEGAGAAVAAVIYSLPVLILLGGVSAAALVYPRLTDVATDPADPPAFVDPVPLQPDEAGEPPDDGQPAGQAPVYGDLGPKSYPLPIAAIYAAARTLVEDRGWAVTEDVPPRSAPIVKDGKPAAPQQPEDPAVTKALAAKGEASQSRGEVVRAAPRPDVRIPTGPETVTLQAIARTPLFGFPDYVVLRIRAEGNGTRIDMRSASGTGMHDLGQNARRIRGFLADLDTALQPSLVAPPPPPPIEAPAAPVEQPAGAGPPTGDKAQPATQ